MFRPTLTTVLLILPLLSPVHSQTTLTGDIGGRILDASKSPYIVESDISVPSGAKCTIPAGCIFLFKPFTGLTVEGTLVVAGTSDHPVVFTSVNNTDFNPESGAQANPFDWNGITVAAESNGTLFSNIQLSYSVYGIKSLTPNLTAYQCIFSQNGQYHFTVKDKIFEVKGGIPFSYPTSASAPDAEVAAIQKPVPASPTPVNNTKPALPPPPKKQQPPTTSRKNIIRFGSLGIGAVGIIGGAVLTKRAFDEKDRIESMDPYTINPATGRYYESTDDVVVDANSSLDRMNAGSIVGFIFGGLGLTGCALTFFF